VYSPNSSAGTTTAACIKGWTGYRILIQCWLSRSQ